MLVCKAEPSAENSANLLTDNNLLMRKNLIEDLEKIKQKSFSMKSELENLNAKSEYLFAKKLHWSPTLDFIVGKDQVGLNSLPTVSSDYWKLSAGLNLFKGGGENDLKKAADADFQSQSYKLKDEELKLENRSSLLIFKNLYLKDTLKTTEELVRLRDESHRIILLKYRQGKIPLQEVTKSEVDKTQQEVRLRSLQLELLENSSQWKSIMMLEQKTQDWPFIESTKPKSIIGKKNSEAHPEINKLQLATESYKFNWQSSKASHWPRLDLVANYREFPINDPSNKNKEWSVSMFMTLPLWNQMATSANSSLAYAQYMTAQNELKIAIQSETARKEILWQRIELARNNLVSTIANLQKSKSLYNDMLKSFRLGRLSVNELLIEQNRLIESEINLSQSKLFFHQIIVDSCSTLGLKIEQCF